MTQAEMKELARTVAKETVHETFTALGLDVKDPVAVQDQFAFLRYCYYGARHLRNVALSAVGGLVFTGICWAVWAKIGTH
jgi:hypothetical protein